jgi:(1->4)-alpha-D-glucan 1-alpha-D-glucosylmutase
MNRAPDDRTALARRLPGATYRLQFNHSFTFADARAIVPYLARLGISDVYASPLLKAMPGSMHGYDIVDHNQINPEIGGSDGLTAFIETLHAHGLHLLLDIVPNHMGIGSANAWWQDVLESGLSSRYASFFDIDWAASRPEMPHTVLLPILGDQFGRVLEAGELRLAYRDGGFCVLYYDHVLPISPTTYDAILQPALEHARERLPPEADALIELRSILTAVSHLPPLTASDPESIAIVAQEKTVIRRRLSALYDTSSEVRTAIEAAVTAFNGTPGVPATWDQLAGLLDRQAYRLSYWRVAAEEINYRRFFDVNSLAALRMDRPEVFEATHGLLLLLAAAHAVDGFRIDHPDGLLDPEGYLRRLQVRVGQVLTGRAVASTAEPAEAAVPPTPLEAASAALSADDHPFYVIVEKILGHGETLPPSWPVDGTTGYEFINALNGIFVDAANRRALDALYSTFLGRRVVFRDLLYETKKQIMRSVLASEVNVLGGQLTRLASRHRRYRDFTRNALTAALIEVIACFPVYRTYIRPDGSLSERDRAYIDTAVERAVRRNPASDRTIYRFIHETLTLTGYTRENGGPDPQQIDFALKFQQVCAPVMAKSLEDTAFYSYTRLVSLNEVGGDPEQFGVSVSAFHRQNAERLQRWRGSLLALSTHDTKRSEDVRARINVLSELPREWRAAVRRWSALNRKHKRGRARERFPDRNAEYLFYQTLAGAWPLELLDAAGDSVANDARYADFVHRMHAYMEKAAREAKVYTSWIAQNDAYEEALHAFIDGALGQPESNPFVREALPFIRRVAAIGMTNSLAQTLLKLASPGVPDTYQGTELWDFSLVDPDNRRPVDFRRRVAALDTICERLGRDGAEALAADLLSARPDGRIKLYLVHRILAFRAAHPDLFGPDATYQPLEALGPYAQCVVAFRRATAAGAVLAVAPRLTAQLSPEGEPPLGSIWQDTALAMRDPAGTRYRDILTGREVVIRERDGAPALLLCEALAVLPVALLERIESN